MSGRARHLGACAIAVAICAGAHGCAKDPTSVYTVVDVAADVPPVLLLRTTVARVDDPTRKASSMRASPNAGDAGDRPGPWIFPIGLSITVDASLAGAATITIESLDWDSGRVTAAGNTDAVIEAQKQVFATLELTATGGAATDGGTPDAGTD